MPGHQDMGTLRAVSRGRDGTVRCPQRPRQRGHRCAGTAPPGRV